MTTKDQGPNGRNHEVLTAIEIMADRLSDMIDRAISLKDQLDDLASMVTETGHLSDQEAAAILTYLNETGDLY